MSKKPKIISNALINENGEVVIIDNDDSTSIKKEPEITIGDAITPTVTLDQVIMDENKKRTIVESVSNFINFYKDKENVALFKEFYNYGNGLILLFTGTSGCGKTMLAHALANHFGKKIVNIGFNGQAVDTTYLDNNDNGITMHETSGHLTNALNSINQMNAIALLDEADKTQYREWNVANIMNLIESFDGIMIVIANNNTWCNGSLMRRIQHIYRFDIPTKSEQELIWKSNIPDIYKELFKSVDFANLAHAFNFTGGLIKNIIQSAIRESYNYKSNHIPHERMVEMCVNLSRQIFTQYHQSTKNSDSFFCGASYSNPMITIDKSIYKKDLEVIDTLIGSYDEYRRVYGTTIYSNGNGYDDTLLMKGRATILNSSNVSYALQIMLEALRLRKSSARIVIQEELFDTKIIPHPLYKFDTIFIESISDTILGQRCPLIIIDNNVNDIINKLTLDLQIIASKTSKKIMYLNQSFMESPDINETDADNTTNTISRIGEMMMGILKQDYCDVYFLVSSKDGNNIDNYCKSINNVFYVDLSGNAANNSSTIKKLIEMLKDSTIRYNESALYKIFEKDAINKINVLDLSNLIKRAYMMSAIDNTNGKKKRSDRFYAALSVVYNHYKMRNMKNYYPHLS